MENTVYEFGTQKLRVKKFKMLMKMIKMILLIKRIVA